MAEPWKRCNLCRKLKSLQDYYFSNNRARGQCKSCVIKKNVIHQKINKTWKTRYATDEERRAHFRAYYANNKEKYAKYRSDFAERHPGYHRHYYAATKKPGNRAGLTQKNADKGGSCKLETRI